MSTKGKIQRVKVPDALADQVNNVKERILQLSPSVLNGEGRECSRDDFESLVKTSIGEGGFSKVYKVRHK